MTFERLIEGEGFAPEDLELTYEDHTRLRVPEAGDPVRDYIGFPDIQRYIIAEEKATRRLTGGGAVLTETATIINIAGPPAAQASGE